VLLVGRRGRRQLAAHPFLPERVRELASKLGSGSESAVDLEVIRREPVR